MPCGTEVLFSRKAKGRVTGLSGGVLTVATGGAKHLVARLTTGTKVRRLGARVPRAAIRTGRTVKLKLALGTTGLVEASSVSIATPTAFGPVYTPKERAIVASVSRRGFIVRELGKSVRAAFRVDARTRVERRGRTAKSRVLRVGEAVNVRFAVRAGGILVAVRVEVGRRAGSNLVFPKTKRGALLSLSARNLVLRTAKGKRLRFAVNRRTFFGRPRATFRRGARVNVTYDPARNSATALVVVRS